MLCRYRWDMTNKASVGSSKFVSICNNYTVSDTKKHQTVRIIVQSEALSQSNISWLYFWLNFLFIYGILGSKIVYCVNYKMIVEIFVHYKSHKTWLWLFISFCWDIPERHKPSLILHVLVLLPYCKNKLTWVGRKGQTVISDVLQPL